jgi:hypothetical protein
VCVFIIIIIGMYGPVWATTFLGFPDQHDFYGVGLLTPRPTPNLEDQTSVFMTPGDRVTQLYPRHWVPILVAFYDTHELRWDYSYPPVTTRRRLLVLQNDDQLTNQTTNQHFIRIADIYEI